MIGAANDPTANNAIEAAGMPVVSVIFDNVSGLEYGMQLIGAITGEQSNAQQLVNYYNQQLSSINSTIGKVTPQNEPRVLFIANNGGKTVTIAGNFFPTALISDAGGQSVSSNTTGGWVPFSVEQAIAWNPDVIVTADSVWNASAIMASSQWSPINAVKNNQVYSIPSDGDTWFMAAKSILFTEWLAQTLYPKAFASVNLENEVNSFYQEFYGITYQQVFGNATYMKNCGSSCVAP